MMRPQFTFPPMEKPYLHVHPDPQQLPAWLKKVCPRRSRHVLLSALIVILYLSSLNWHSRFPIFGPQRWASHRVSTDELFVEESFHLPANFPPLLPDLNHPGQVIMSPNRVPDVHDAFANFNKREDCSLSSLDLHDAFEPLCPDMASLLPALSGGGRAGIDMPYRPRGCDMRWFSTGEICEILSRFSFIHVIGDSMMRNLANAMHIFAREDLVNGGWLGWTTPPDGADCSCSKPFDSSKCIFNAAFTSRLIWENDPTSMKCPRETTPRIEYNTQTTFPLGHDVDGLIAELPTIKPSRPHAFIIGHGIWNGLNETATEGFLGEIQDAINKTMPWVSEPGQLHPRLFLTPSASGDNKPVQFQETQGNVALRRFESNMGPMVREWGFDHLGIFNLTLQNTTPDGTHAGMRSNLIKAMMVFNWLNMLDTTQYML